MTGDLSTRTFFNQSSLLFLIFAGGLLALGLGIRLYDLTDPPLGTRQLRSAVIARGMYYQGLGSAPEWKRAIAVAQWKEEAVIEPPLLERLVALSYRVSGGEYLWLARLLSSLFWVLSGIALLALTRDMKLADGGLISLAYYLFLPFAILESRTFQPDPLMVSLVTVSLWAIYRWYLRRTWTLAVVAGLLAGLAIFAKTVAAFPLLAAWAGLVLGGVGLRKAARDSQIWAISALSLLPSLLYYVYGTLIADFLVQQFSLRFFPNLISEPAFYVRWMNQIGFKAGYGAFLVALVGVLLLRSRAQRGMAIGLLSGYFIYGLSLPFHITTHDYYQLPLIPIVALLLAPVAEAVFRHLATYEPSALARVGVVGILFFGMAFKIWEARVALSQRDDRGEGVFWEFLGEKLGHDSAVIGLTQDYGYRLAYFGWLRPQHWFTAGDFELRELAGHSADDLFREMAAQLAGKDYFLITLFGEFEGQPELQSLLYSNYPVYDEGGGYLIFDLRHPLANHP